MSTNKKTPEIEENDPLWPIFEEVKNNSEKINSLSKKVKEQNFWIMTLLCIILLLIIIQPLITILNS
jgi:hypothetical protein